ncbi:MAG: TIGR02757 family protein [Pseudomonadota bacterium]
MKNVLEDLYCRYNKREYVHPDPLEFLYNYSEIRDREIAGFIASSLAYGRVAQILKSVSSVLDKMGPSPYSFLVNSKPTDIKKNFKGFKHRFADDRNLYAALIGLKYILMEYGSLYDCFLKGIKENDETILGSMEFFAKKIVSGCNASPGHLVPVVEKGSACKRLHLFLRWMVRKDDVDPGGWDMISSSMLIIPLDVHMHKIGRLFGFTNRKQADILTALEITSGFRKLVFEDPVKYDFTLTRFGIRDDMDIDSLLKECHL